MLCGSLPWLHLQILVEMLFQDLWSHLGTGVLVHEDLLDGPDLKDPLDLSSGYPDKNWCSVRQVTDMILFKPGFHKTAWVVTEAGEKHDWHWQTNLDMRPACSTSSRRPPQLIPSAWPRSRTAPPGHRRSFARWTGRTARHASTPARSLLT